MQPVDDQNVRSGGNDYTVGGRAFPVAGRSVWNSLPDTVTSAPTLSTFRQRLKTYLYIFSFPDIRLDG